MRKGLYMLFSIAVMLALCAFFLPEKTESDDGDKRFFGAIEGIFKASTEETREEKAVLPSEIVLRVYRTGENRIEEMPVEDYVAGVIAAEMPMNSASEALKAQAIAARTFAIYKSRLHTGEGCRSCPDADVCTSSGCCQGYREAQGAEYASARKAAADTSGQILTFRSRPIYAMYHACSGGYTENAENVYSEALAYLRGVPSPGEEEYQYFQSEQMMDINDLRNAFQGHSDVRFLDDAPLFDQLEVLSRSETGRVTSIRVGLTSMSGNDFRRAVGIKSALFDMDFPEKSVVFSVTGFGHGVGMSQAGAQAMAEGGASAEEILLHYYTGVTLTDLAAWMASG